MVGSRGLASRWCRQDCRGSTRTTMENFWIRLKPCPVTLMLRPPLGWVGWGCLRELEAPHPAPPPRRPHGGLGRVGLESPTQLFRLWVHTQVSVSVHLP